MSGAGRRLGSNAAWGLAGQALGIAVALATTPVLLRGLGEARYGLWTVAGSVGQWLGFLGLMFSTVSIRFAGQALGRADAQDAARARAALGRMALWAASAGAFLLALCSPRLARSLGGGNGLREAGMVLLSQALLAAFQLCASVEQGVVAAHQRLDLVQVGRIGCVALQGFGSALLVLAGGGLEAAAFWTAGVQGLEWAAEAFFARRLLGADALKAGASEPMGPWWSRIWRYGGTLLAGYGAGQLLVPTSRFLLGLLRPLEEAAYFSVPAGLAGNVRVLSTHIAAALLPAVSEASGREGMEEVRHLYLRALRWSWLALAPVSGVACALGGEFLAAWLGRDFASKAGPLVPILTAGLSVHVLGGIPGAVAQARGRASSWAMASLAAGLTNVLLSLLWIPARGPAGAAWALAFSGALYTLWMLAWARRALEAGWGECLRAFDWRVAASTAAAVLALGGWAPGSPGLAVVLLRGLAGLAVASLALPFCLDSEERAWLERRLGIGAGSRVPASDMSAGTWREENDPRGPLMPQGPGEGRTAAPGLRQASHKTTAWRVAFVSASAGMLGGGEESLLCLLGALDRSAFAPVLAVPEEGELARRARGMGVEAHVLPLPHTARGILDGSLLTWRSWLRREDIRLIHANSAGRALLLEGLAAHSLGLPLVWHARIGWKEPVSDRLGAALCARIIATSAWVAARFSPFADGKVSVIPNPVDLERFGPGAGGAQWRASKGIGEDALLVGAAGRLEDYKRFDTAVNAFALAARKEPRLLLVLLGDGPERGPLERLARALGLEGRVLFPGWIKDTAPAFDALDALLHPMPEDGFGRDLIESMACGTPAVAAAAGGALDVVVPEQTGLLVPPGDARAMAGALLRLCVDAGLRRRLGEAGRRRAESLYSARLVAARVVREYRGILDPEPGAPGGWSRITATAGRPA